MSPFIPAAERITKARALIQKARKLPAPEDLGWGNFEYVAKVKDLLRKAHELIQFIPLTSGMPEETKAEAAQVEEEIAQAMRDLLR